MVAPVIRRVGGLEGSRRFRWFRLCVIRRVGGLEVTVNRKIDVF